MSFVTQHPPTHFSCHVSMPCDVTSVLCRPPHPGGQPVVIQPPLLFGVFLARTFAVKLLTRSTFSFLAVTVEMREKLMVDRDRDVLVAIHELGYEAPRYRCKPEPEISSDVNKSDAGWGDAPLSPMRTPGES